MFCFIYYFYSILFYVGVVEVGCAHAIACMPGKGSEGNQYMSDLSYPHMGPGSQT